MIDPDIRKALERARDRNNYRSVTIRRDHLMHVLASDAVMQMELAAARERLAKTKERLDFEIDYASPFPRLGPYGWPLLLVIAALSGWL